MSTLDIKPTQGKVALQLLDDGDEDQDTEPMAANANPTPEDYNETIYAIVIGVGPDVKGIKKGSTVLVRSFVRNDPRVSDDVVISESWNVLATVSG